MGTSIVHCTFNGSVERIRQASRYLPGGVSSNFRLGISPTPLVFDHADGPFLYDIDGNRLIDYYLGMGPMILGHKPASVVKAATEQMEKGILYAGQTHVEVEVAYLCSQQVRSVYHQPTHAQGRAVAEKILDSFTSCPIPEVKRLGKTLTQWRTEFLGYFDTDGANNGGTEAINGLIELHRRIARGFRNRDNYRLRMLLIAGGLNL